MLRRTACDKTGAGLEHGRDMQRVSGDKGQKHRLKSFTQSNLKALPSIEVVSADVSSSQRSNASRGLENLENTKGM
jgi:hypothetical protein